MQKNPQRTTIRRTPAALLALALAPAALGQVGRLDEWPTAELNRVPAALRSALYRSVATGYGYTVALLADGHVVGWLNPDPGATAAGGPWVAFDSGGHPAVVFSPPLHTVDPPSYSTLFQAISCSYTHVLGLTTGGDLIAWGENDQDECTIPDLHGAPWNWPSTESVVQISAGEYINIVRSSGGYIAAWGDRSYGVDPRGRTSQGWAIDGYTPEPACCYTSVAAGGHFVMALRSDGELLSWGTWDYAMSIATQCDTPLSGHTVVGPHYRGCPNMHGLNPGYTGPALYDPPYKTIGAGHQVCLALTAYDASRPTRAENVLHTFGANGSQQRSAQGQSFLSVIGTYQGGVGRTLTQELDSWGQSVPDLTPHNSNFPTNYTFLGPANSSVYVAALTCYANCDGSTGSPVLNVNDFVCFQSRFAKGDLWADCDNDGVLTTGDMACFQNAFAGGCP